MWSSPDDPPIWPEPAKGTKTTKKGRFENGNFLTRISCRRIFPLIFIIFHQYLPWYSSELLLTIATVKLFIPKVKFQSKEMSNFRRKIHKVPDCAQISTSFHMMGLPWLLCSLLHCSLSPLVIFLLFFETLGWYVSARKQEVLLEHQSNLYRRSCHF